VGAWAVIRTPRHYPSAELLKEIEFVDSSTEDIVHALKVAGLFNNTLIIVTAKAWGLRADPGAKLQRAVSVQGKIHRPRHSWG
jgi:hypothetical protein